MMVQGRFPHWPWGSLVFYSTRNALAPFREPADGPPHFYKSQFRYTHDVLAHRLLFPQEKTGQ